MGALLGTLMRVAAGLGLGYLIDKLVPDPPVPKTGLSSMPILRLVILAITIVVGILLISFTARKLKIKIPKV